MARHIEILKLCARDEVGASIPEERFTMRRTFPVARGRQHICNHRTPGYSVINHCADVPVRSDSLDGFTIPVNCALCGKGVWVV